MDLIERALEPDALLALLALILAGAAAVLYIRRPDRRSIALALAGLALIAVLLVPLL